MLTTPSIVYFCLDMIKFISRIILPENNKGGGFSHKSKIKHPLKGVLFLFYYAAGVGFEPTVLFRVQLFSRQPRSSAPASRQK